MASRFGPGFLVRYAKGLQGHRNTVYRLFRNPDVYRGSTLGLMFHDTDVMVEDFHGATSVYRATVSQSGSTVTADALGSRVNIATGASSGNSGSVHLPMSAPAAREPGMSVVFTANPQAATGFEIGLVAARTSKTVRTVTDIDVPTIGNGGGANIAVLAKDPTQTYTGWRFIAGKTGDYGFVNASQFTDPDPNKPCIVTIQIVGADAYCWIYELDPATGLLTSRTGSDPLSVLGKIDSAVDFTEAYTLVINGAASQAMTKRVDVFAAWSSRSKV